MGQKAMVRFFILKGITPGNIQARLLSLYGTDKLFCKQSTNGIIVLLKGEPNSSIIRDLADSYRMISLKPLVL
jgi:hypothetical protein